MRIGVSLASYLPWTAVSAQRVAYWAKAAGYEFLQVVPFRSVSVLVNGVLPVIYLEEAWNPAYGARGPDPLTPILWHDRLFFPSREACIAAVHQFRQFGARLISHDVGDLAAGDPDMLVEVHPGLWRTPREIAAELCGDRLVLDLYHMRRTPRVDELAHRPCSVSVTESLLGRWEESLLILLPRAAVVHVSPLRSDGGRERRTFLRDQWTELEVMLRMLIRAGFDGDLVVEATLGLGGFAAAYLRANLCLFRERLASIIRVVRKTMCS